jgi:hypothetical protein
MNKTEHRLRLRWYSGGDALRCFHKQLRAAMRRAGNWTFAGLDGINRPTNSLERLKI